MTDRRNTVFGIDLRGLAGFRIGMGALLLADLWMRAGDLVAHYTDAGVLPRELLEGRLQESWRWSWHMFGGSTEYQAVMFVTSGAAAAALMLGYRTRIATIVSWLMLLSLHVRNPLVINSGDVLIRVLLFWSLFLPLSDVWSLDRRRAATANNTSPFASMATAAVLLQVACMYWMSAYFKWHGVWLDSDGFRSVLELDSYAKPFAYVLLRYPALLPWLGYGVLALEIVGPILVFSPIATKRLRLIVVPCFVALHLGIDLSLTVGLFSVTAILAWTLFLPDVFWNRLTGHYPFPNSPANSRQTGLLATTGGGPLSRVSAFVVAALIVFVAAWNFSTVRGTWLNSQQRTLQPLADLSGLRQKWNMFTRPPRRDGWYIAVARLEDGRVVDLLRDGQPADWESYEKPKYIYRRFPNHRWRKFYRNLAQQRGDATFPFLCRYLGHAWNTNHSAEQAAESVELHFMEPIGSEPEEADRFMQRILQVERLTSH